MENDNLLGMEQKSLHERVADFVHAIDRNMMRFNEE